MASPTTVHASRQSSLATLCRRMIDSQRSIRASIRSVLLVVSGVPGGSFLEKNRNREISDREPGIIQVEALRNAAEAPRADVRAHRESPALRNRTMTSPLQITLDPRDGSAKKARPTRGQQPPTTRKALKMVTNEANSHSL